MRICLRRREFIAALGGAAAWPLAARAQQGDRVRRIGVLWPETEANIAFIQRSLRDELQKLNWIEGRNLLFDVRFGDGDPVRIRAYAAELVSLKPDVIVTVGSLATRAVQQQTPTIPIVFVVGSDPFSSGLVKSVARPEGNTTGIGGAPSSLGSKWVQLLKEAAPNIKRIALLYSLQSLQSPIADTFTSIDEAAHALAIQLIRIPYSNATEIERGIDAFAAEPNGGLIIGTTPGEDRQPLLGLATKYRLPAMYWNRAYVAEGGLMSYAPNGLAANGGEHYRRLASHVDRILRGAKPSDLPVEYPTRFDLVINLKAAKAMGIEIPPTLIAIADEVIE